MNIPTTVTRTSTETIHTLFAQTVRNLLRYNPQAEEDGREEEEEPSDEDEDEDEEDDEEEEEEGEEEREEEEATRGRKRGRSKVCAAASNHTRGESVMHICCLPAFSIFPSSHSVTVLVGT